MALSNRMVHLLRSLLLSRRLLPICLVAAIGLRLILVALFRVTPVSDFEWYYRRAVELAHGQGLTFRGHPTAYWPVGYPAFLMVAFSLFGTSVWVAQCANIVLSIGILLLSYRIAFKISNSALAASAALLVLVLFPNQIAYSTLVASEPLGCFSMLLGLWLLLPEGRGRVRDLLSGLVFGAACLVKPQLFFLPGTILVIEAIVERRERRKASLGPVALRAGVIYLSLIAVLTPWTIRNYRAFGGFVFIANTGGENLLIGNNPDATGTYPTRAVEDKLHHLLLPLAANRDEYATDKKARDLAISYLRSHPLEALLRLPRKIFYLYAKDADGFSWMQEGAPQRGGRYRLLTAGKVLAQLYYGLVLLLFASTLLSAFRRNCLKQIWRPLAVIGYLTALYSVYFGISRFHFLAIPWIAIQVGSLVAVWLEKPTLEAPPALRAVSV